MVLVALIAMVIAQKHQSTTSKLKASLPFELTTAQVRATREIVRDMTSGERMHRLLQGDVGSGKTVVALFAALLGILVLDGVSVRFSMGAFGLRVDAFVLCVGLLAGLALGLVGAAMAAAREEDIA